MIISNTNYDKCFDINESIISMLLFQDTSYLVVATTEDSGHFTKSNLIGRVHHLRSVFKNPKSTVVLQRTQFL